MFVESHPRARVVRGLRRFASLLACLAQVAVVLAPVAEGLGGVGMAAHVEAPGSTTHYAHNEATCAACAAQSLHAAGARRITVLLPLQLHESVASAAAPRVPKLDPISNLFSRAPPTVI